MTPSNIINSQEEYDRFLREVVVPTYDAMKADPSRGITIEQMRETLAEWDREDGLLPDESTDALKRSA